MIERGNQARRNRARCAEIDFGLHSAGRGKTNDD
jgi:hypothetical protein